MHKPCEPWGEASYEDCGDFQKCYTYRNEFAKTNLTLDELYSDWGGICDCHATYGYGTGFPDCDSVSNATLPILCTCGVVPMLFAILVFQASVSAGLQDVAANGLPGKVRGKKRKNTMIKRGGYALVASSVSFIIMQIIIALAILEPLYSDKNIMYHYVFRVALSMCTFFTIPALFILPICWVETIVMSKVRPDAAGVVVALPNLYLTPSLIPRSYHTSLSLISHSCLTQNLKKKAGGYNKSKRILVFMQCVLCLVVAILSAVGWFKAVNFLVTITVLFTATLHIWAKRMLIREAGDIISHGHQAILHMITNRLWAVCVFNLTCAAGYAATADVRDYGTFRLNPTFLSGNFMSVALLQLNTVRYLRYLIRKNLKPSPFLLEGMLWPYLENITKTNMKKVTFEVEVTEVDARGAQTNARRLSHMGKVRCGE